MRLDQRNEVLAGMVLLASEATSVQTLVEYLAGEGLNLPEMESVDPLGLAEAVKQGVEGLQFSHLAGFARNEPAFNTALARRLRELEGALEGAGQAALARRVARIKGSDDCTPCGVERSISRYPALWEGLVALDELLLWPGWRLLGLLHNPKAALSPVVEGVPEERIEPWDEG